MLCWLNLAMYHILFPWEVIDALLKGFILLGVTLLKEQLVLGTVFKRFVSR